MNRVALAVLILAALAIGVLAAGPFQQPNFFGWCLPDGTQNMTLVTNGSGSDQDYTVCTLPGSPAIKLKIQGTTTEVELPACPAAASEPCCTTITVPDGKNLKVYRVGGGSSGDICGKYAKT